ncbi:MAG: type II toxin-antitoxin system VapC family toxin, partial [Mesorhizobium sp.]
MKVSLDTNVLLRLVVGDDEAQQQTAAETLERAELVAISVQALCEFVWVLDRSYRVARPDISASIRRILDMRNVVANRPTIEADMSG